MRHEDYRRTLKARRIARAVNHIFRRSDLDAAFGRGDEAKATFVRGMTDEQFNALIQVAYAKYAPAITPTKPKDQRTRREVIRWFSRRVGR